MVLAAAQLPAVRAVRASAVRAPKVGRPGATNRQATCRGPRRTRRRRRHPRQALGLYWATSGAYSLVQNVALEVRSVRRALGIRPMPSDERTTLHAWTIAAREGRLLRTVLRVPTWPPRPPPAPP